MDMELNWQRELSLKYDSKIQAYDVELDLIPEVPGIYLFGRRFGKSFKALYVGRAKNSLRGRIAQQLNNHKLLNHIWKAKAGQRLVLIGELKTKPRQTPAACLPVAEKSLIRYFVSERHDLVNIQGVKLRHHQVSSTGLHKVLDFPKSIEVEVAQRRKA